MAPFFIYFVKDLLFERIDLIAKECHEKCIDELVGDNLHLFSNHTLQDWDVNPTENEKLEMKGEEHRQSWDSKETKIWKHIFHLYDDICSNLSENISLKSHNFLFIKTRNTLGDSVQTAVNELPFPELSRMFDMELNRKELQKEVKLIEEVKTMAIVHEKTALGLAAKFYAEHEVVSRRAKNRKKGRSKRESKREGLLDEDDDDDDKEEEDDKEDDREKEKEMEREKEPEKVEDKKQEDVTENVREEVEILSEIEKKKKNEIERIGRS